MEWYLPVIWGLIIGVAVIMYVILDGFDLGIGILLPFAKTESERDTMVNTVAPFWDGNETWLILGGGGLWVAFPGAYAVVMPGLYLPMILMLLALVFRGVAFEFRWVAQTSRKWWNLAFSGGALVAAFCQGMILGGLLQGIKVENGVFAGGPMDWLTPFALLCGVGVVTGYAMLGATWLLVKTEGELAARARKLAEKLLFGVLALMVAVSVSTPLVVESIAVRWFSTPNIYFLAPVPFLTTWLAYGVWRWLRSDREMLPFFGTIGLFLLGFLGLAASVFPYLVPPSLTVWQTAAAAPSQVLMLFGVIFLLPVVLGYIVFVYWTFRGKVREGEGYH